MIPYILLGMSVLALVAAFFGIKEALKEDKKNEAKSRRLSRRDYKFISKW